MRRIFLYTFALLATLGATTAFAGNVLLPSATAPNLGLLPKTQSSDNVSPEEQGEKEKNVVTPLPLPTAPVPSPTETTSIKDKILNFLFDKKNQSRSNTPSTPQIDIQTIIREAQKRGPTIVDIDEKTLSSQLATGASNHLPILLGANYTLGQEESNYISTTLGYAPNEVKSRCQLRVKVNAVVNGVPSLNTVFLAPNEQKTLDFDGAPEDFLLSPHVVCDIPSTLPKGTSLILRLGNKYLVILPSGANCPAPPTGTKLLRIEYKGSNEASCSSK